MQTRAARRGSMALLSWLLEYGDGEVMHNGVLLALPLPSLARLALTSNALSKAVHAHVVLETRWKELCGLLDRCVQNCVINEERRTAERAILERHLSGNNEYGLDMSTLSMHAGVRELFRALAVRCTPSDFVATLLSVRTEILVSMAPSSHAAKALQNGISIHNLFEVTAHGLISLPCLRSDEAWTAQTLLDLKDGLGMDIYDGLGEFAELIGDHLDQLPVTRDAIMEESVARGCSNQDLAGLALALYCYHGEHELLLDFIDRALQSDTYETAFIVTLLGHYVGEITEEFRSSEGDAYAPHLEIVNEYAERIREAFVAIDIWSVNHSDEDRKSIIRLFVCLDEQLVGSATMQAMLWTWVRRLIGHAGSVPSEADAGWIRLLSEVMVGEGEESDEESDD